MPSKNLKHISGYLYVEQHVEFEAIARDYGISSARLVREAVLYMLNNEQALLEILENSKSTNYRKRTL